MPNPHRGEVAIEGPEGPLTLRFSINAICEVEAALDQPVQQMLAAFETPQGVPLRMIRTLLWGGLIDRHPQMTPAGAGEIMQHLGVPRAVAAIGEALALAFPAAGGDGKKKTPARRRSP